MLTINPSLLPTGVSVGDPGQATVTIVDDDGKFDVLIYSLMFNIERFAWLSKKLHVY